MNFNVTIRHDPSRVLDRVCMLAQDRVVVSGDTSRGEFTGMFDGTYRVSGDLVSVHIAKKPIFVSWAMVQKGLDYLSA